MKFWLTYLGFALMMGGVLILLAGCGSLSTEDQLYKMVSQPQLDSYIEHPEVHFPADRRAS